MKNKGYAKFREGKQDVLHEMCKWRMSRAISRSKTIMGHLGKGLFPLTLKLFAALYFCFPVFFYFFDSRAGREYQYKGRGGWTGACLFPFTPVRLALTLLDFLNVSSSFPWL